MFLVRNCVLQAIASFFLVQRKNNKEALSYFHYTYIVFIKFPNITYETITKFEIRTPIKLTADFSVRSKVTKTIDITDKFKDKTSFICAA